MSRITLLLTALAISASASGAERYVDSLPDESPVIAGYTPSQAEGRLSAEPLTPIEGLWRLTADGGIISVERWIPADRPKDDGIYMRIVMVRGSNRAVRPGTVMGYLMPTARAGTYDARLYTNVSSGATLSGARTFRITMKDDALQFHTVRSGLRVKWPRLLPYPVRYAIDWRADSRDGLDGCVRHIPTPLPRYF